MSSAKTQRTGNTFVLFKRSGAPLALFVALCLLLSACLPDGKDKIYTVQIADETFEVPKAYFHRFLPDPDVESLYFAVLYPEFTPLEKSRSEYWHAGRGDDVITFIIESVEDYLPLDEVIEKSKMTFAGDHYAGNYFGMEKWTAKPSDPQEDEFFIYKEDGKNVGYIRCGIKAGALVNPGCSGKFRKFGVAIDISFDKDHFDQWPDIRDKSFALIDEFRVTE